MSSGAPRKENNTPNLSLFSPGSFTPPWGLFPDFLYHHLQGRWLRAWGPRGDQHCLTPPGALLVPSFTKTSFDSPAIHLFSPLLFFMGIPHQTLGLHYSCWRIGSQYFLCSSTYHHLEKCQDLADDSLKTLASQFLGFFKCNDFYLLSTQLPTAIKWSKAQKPGEKKMETDEQEIKRKHKKDGRSQAFSLGTARELKTPFWGWSLTCWMDDFMWVKNLDLVW